MAQLLQRRSFALLLLLLFLSAGITLVKLEAYSRSLDLSKIRSEVRSLTRTQGQLRVALERRVSPRSRVAAQIPYLPEEDFLGKYVDVLRGCKMFDPRALSKGNIYPMVTRPWGFARWSISSAGRKQPWFFSNAAKSFENIRYTHQPSPWIGDYSYFTVRPLLRVHEEEDSKAHVLKFDKAEFSANRMYLELLLRGKEAFTVELTGTRHGGRMRFGYHVANESSTRGVEFNNVRLFSATRASNRVVDFYFVTDLLILKHSLPYRHRRELVTTVVGQILLPEGAGDVQVGWNGVTWRHGGAVEILIGTSYISAKQARLHLQREVMERSMEALARESKAEWNGILGRIKVRGGFPEEKRMLYTAIYRASLFPSRLGEVDKDGIERHASPYNYWRPDKVYEGPLSSDSGFWDAYRTVYPMLHLVYPEIAEEIIEGWINAIREDPNHMLPQWSAPGRVGSMVGTMGETTIAEAIVNGAVRERSLFDAYHYLKRSATTIVRNGRDYMKEYIDLGYVPSAYRHSTSITLNYKLADFSVSQAAKLLGDIETADLLHNRSKAWKKIFNPENLFLAPKTRDGTFPRLDEFRWQRNFTEGCAWHYRFYVPHDPHGLREAYQAGRAEGEESVMCQKLKETLTHRPRVSGGAGIHEQREMMKNGIGLYAHNNQPVHHMLYMFTHAGCARSGQEYIFKALKTQYGEFGYSGDEDNGEMSSWYILSALGLYSLAPGSGKYQVGAPPLFKEVIISRKKGGPLYIRRDSNRENAASFNPARKIVWNGKEMDVLNTTAEIVYNELLRGGTLRFE